MFDPFMALELGPSGIRVNSVNPTVTMTPMGVLAWSDPTKADPLNSVPLKIVRGTQQCYTVT